MNACRDCVNFKETGVLQQSGICIAVVPFWIENTGTCFRKFRAKRKCGIIRIGRQGDAEAIGAVAPTKGARDECNAGQI